MKTLPERLEAELKAEGESQGTKGKRQVWFNKKFGITLVVTWAPPRMDVGIQQFSCSDFPLARFRSYEELRTYYAKHWSEKT